MHIEPGLISPEKMLLAYATAAAAGGITAKLAWDALKEQGPLSLLARSAISTAAVFCFFEMLPHHPVGVSEVDAKLVQICLRRKVSLLTLDQHLADAAGLAGVSVLNLHALAKAMAAPVASGEVVDVHLARPGKESGQAVGHLADGTMVIVQRADHLIGDTVGVQVTSVTTTSHGRLVFAKLAHP